MLEPVVAISNIHAAFLTCFGYDFELYAGLLYHSQIRLHRAETLDQADFLLSVTPATVLLSDTLFLDGTWQDALELVHQVHPRVRFLVVADPVDRGFVAGALSRGACDVLWKPLDLTKLRRTINTVHEATLECELADQRRPTAISPGNYRV